VDEIVGGSTFYNHLRFPSAPGGAGLMQTERASMPPGEGRSREGSVKGAG
jgi:hypothetical protein